MPDGQTQNVQTATPLSTQKKQQQIAEGLVGFLIYKTKLATYWDKLSNRQQKWIIRSMGVFFALGYIGILKLFHVWIRPDHAFIAFLIFVLFFGNALTFLKYWGPFILLWLTYDMLRGIAWLIMPHIYVQELYYTELWLTGWMFKGNILPFALQNMKANLEGTTFIIILDWIGAFYYVNHMTAVILLAWLLYWKQEDKTEFKRLVYTIILTSWSAFITFVLFPSAAPWYVWNGGNGLRFTQPTRNIKPSAGGLIDLDRLSGFNFFQSFYETFNANPYAAFPSLHAAYSLTVFLFTRRKWKRWGNLAVIWPLGMWFFAMYLNHHYIIDLLWGAFYALSFYNLSLRIFKPQKKAEKEQSNNEVNNQKMNTKEKIEENNAEIEKETKNHETAHTTS